MVADPAYIAERRDRLVGLVITHAHEDHVGGVPYLCVRCVARSTPPRSPPRLLRRKLAEADLLNEVPLRVVQPGAAFDLPPFSLQFIRMAHSIPEAQSLVIRTPAGTVLHTGDWKFDPDPLVGPRTDEAALARLGEAGRAGHRVRPPPMPWWKAIRVRRRTCGARFPSSSLAGGPGGGDLLRQQRGAHGIGGAGRRDAGRRVAMVGRSLRNIEAAARECGYLKGIPAFATEDDVNDIARRQPADPGHRQPGRAAFGAGAHRARPAPRIELGEGDTVVFSAVSSPATSAHRTMQDNLVRRGVQLHDRRRPQHPRLRPSARDELRRLYRPG